VSSASADLSPPALIETALVAYDDYRYSDAQRLFEQLLAAKPDDPKLNFYLGRIALWFDDAPKGLAYLEKALLALPDDAGVQNALGDAFGLTAQKASLFSKLSWAAKSKAAYERAVRLDPKNLTFRWSLLGFYQLAPKIAGGGLDKAYAQAAEIRKIDSLSGRAAFAALELFEKKVKEAFAEFDDVLRQTPDDYQALYHVGRCTAASGQQLDRGLAALKRCLVLEASAGHDRLTRACVHYRLGNVLERKGDATAARAEYDLALKEQPDFRPDKVALRY
jgi:tetratricopeptide (TPR) repeat protein